MSCWPPKGVFAQRVAALNQLTTRACTLYGGTEGSVGRQLFGAVSPLGNFGDIPATDAVAAIPGATMDADFGLTCATTDYICKRYVEDDPHYAFWQGGGHGAKHGIGNGGIWNFWDWYESSPPDPDLYYLLKASIRPEGKPGAIQCIFDPPYNGIYNSHHADDVWSVKIPTAGEWLAKRTAPAAIAVGNSLITLGVDPPEYVEHLRWGVYACCELHASTPLHPDLLAHVGQGTQILGAWAKVTLSDFSITTQEISGHCETIEPGGYPNLQWDRANMVHAESGSTTSEGNVSFIAVGIKGPYGNNEFDVICGGTLDVANVESDVPQWVDMTNLFQALMADGAWNGPYSSIHLIPYSPSMDLALGPDSFDPAKLAALMPPISDSAEIDGNGRPVSFDYHIGPCAMLTMSAFSISDLHIAVQLPDGTIDRFMAYTTIPALDQ